MLKLGRYPVYYKGHPRMYIKEKPILWWLHKWAYTKFIIRELTSVPVAFYAVIMILQIRALGQGPEAYAAFVTWLKTPLSLTIHLIALTFIIYHSITWFNLAPKAIVIRIGKTRIPGALIAGANYGAWLIFSIAIGWILLNLDTMFKP